jgi:hypothetical protein
MYGSGRWTVYHRSITSSSDSVDPFLRTHRPTRGHHAFLLQRLADYGEGLNTGLALGTR